MFCKCVALLDVYLTVRFVFHFVIVLIHIQSPPEANTQTLFCSFVSHIKRSIMGSITTEIYLSCLQCF